MHAPNVQELCFLPQTFPETVENICWERKLYIYIYIYIYFFFFFFFFFLEWTLKTYQASNAKHREKKNNNNNIKKKKKKKKKKNGMA